MRLYADEDGQLHTVEGIVAALILIFAVIYITGAINLVSPQIEKSAVTKLSVTAEDMLTVLGTVDQPSNYSSVLLRNVSAWEGHEGTSTAEIDPAEPSILNLDHTISSMLPANVMYNMYVAYWNETSRALETKKLIYQGDPQFSAVSASKKIVMNGADLQDLTDSYWYDIVKPYELARPQTVEIRLVVWMI